MAAILTNSKLPVLLTLQDRHFNSGLWVWIVWNLGIEYGFIQSSGCMLARFWAYGKAFTIKLMCWFYKSALPLFTLHISWETWKIKELWQNRDVQEGGKNANAKGAKTQPRRKRKDKRGQSDNASKVGAETWAWREWKREWEGRENVSEMGAKPQARNEQKSKRKMSNTASKKLAKYWEKWRAKTRMRSEQKREREASKNANEKRAKRDQEAS